MWHRLTRLLEVTKQRGILGVAAAIAGRPHTPRLHCAAEVMQLVGGRAGLEIGGPTQLFARDGLLPIYGAIGSLDNCNFSHRTIWEGTIAEGRTFDYDPSGSPGVQFIGEASSLPMIGDEQYDVVLSSHTLEHCANPLKALREWLRVLRRGGVLVLVLPHKDATFDHRRPVTRLAHLLDDERVDTGEADLTHLPEILALHDLALDPPAGDLAAFTERSKLNLANRCLHHHVFDTRLAIEVVDAVGLQVVHAEAALAHHIFVVARKIERADNHAFLRPDARWRPASPFASDQA